MFARATIRDVDPLDQRTAELGTRTARRRPSGHGDQTRLPSRLDARGREKSSLPRPNFFALIGTTGTLKWVGTSNTGTGPQWHNGNWYVNDVAAGATGMSPAFSVAQMYAGAGTKIHTAYGNNMVIEYGKNSIRGTDPPTTCATQARSTDIAWTFVTGGSFNNLDLPIINNAGAALKVSYSGSARAASVGFTGPSGSEQVAMLFRPIFTSANESYDITLSGSIAASTADGATKWQGTDTSPLTIAISNASSGTGNQWAPSAAIASGSSSLDSNLHGQIVQRAIGDLQQLLMIGAFGNETNVLLPAVPEAGGTVNQPGFEPYSGPLGGAPSQSFWSAKSDAYLNTRTAGCDAFGRWVWQNSESVVSGTSSTGAIYSNPYDDRCSQYAPSVAINMDPGGGTLTVHLREINVVPEPPAVALLGIGGAAVGGADAGCPSGDGNTHNGRDTLPDGGRRVPWNGDPGSQDRDPAWRRLRHLLHRLRPHARELDAMTLRNDSHDRHHARSQRRCHEVGGGNASPLPCLSTGASVSTISPDGPCSARQRRPPSSVLVIRTIHDAP